LNTRSLYCDSFLPLVTLGVTVTVSEALVLRPYQKIEGASQSQSVSWCYGPVDRIKQKCFIRWIAWRR